MEKYSQHIYERKLQMENNIKWSQLFCFSRKKMCVSSTEKNQRINNMPKVHSCYFWAIGYFINFNYFLCFSLFTLSNFPTMNMDYFLNEK